MEALNKKNGWKQTFKVLDADGKALSKKEYISVKYTVESVGEGGDVSLVGTELKDKDVSKLPKGSVVAIEVELTDSYKGIVRGFYRIIDKDRDISKAVFKTDLQVYTGKEIELSKETDFTKATLKGQSLVFGRDFEIVPGSYQKNINKGTAKVTVRGVEENGYGGEKVVTFKIIQRDVSKNWHGLFEVVSDLLK